MRNLREIYTNEEVQLRIVKHNEWIISQIKEGYSMKLIEAMLVSHSQMTLDGIEKEKI